jgi:hypothetical protein
MDMEQKDIEIGEEAYMDEEEYRNLDSCAALAIIDGVHVPKFYTEEDE